MYRGYAILLGLFLFSSCTYFKPEAKPQAIARVDESYLYKEEIKDLRADLKNDLPKKNINIFLNILISRLLL